MRQERKTQVIKREEKRGVRSDRIIFLDPQEPKVAGLYVQKIRKQAQAAWGRGDAKGW